MSSVFLVTSGLDRASLRRHNRDMQMTGEFTVLEVMPWRWRSAATTTTNPACSPHDIYPQFGSAVFGSARMVA